MECHCLRFSEIPHTTKLFTAYLEDFNSVAKWYPHPPNEVGVLSAAREVSLDAELRRQVVAILHEQNQQFGADAATMRNLDRFAEGAAAVVTGQQVALFSGPAYSFYKALTAIAWSEQLTARGIDAVPIFWLATEDHDIPEINHCFWNGREGISRFELAAGEESSGRPVGEVTLVPAVASLLETGAGFLEGPFSREASQALRDSYRPGETFGSAFGKFFARILAGRGLILVDPLDSRLHRLASDIYRRAAENTEQLQADLLARNKALDAAGYHSQVRVTRETTLLFCRVEGRRLPLRYRGGKFSAGKQLFTKRELLAAIEKSAEIFSGNALLRPIVQDALLSTVAYFAGPAEIAYLAQSEVLYRSLLGRMPAVVPRASFTLIEPHVARLLSKYQLEARDAIQGRQQLRSRLSVRALPRGLASRFERDEQALRRLLQSYQKPLSALDKTLLGALETVERKMLYQFFKLRGKAGRAENFRTGILDRHERMLLDALYPHRGLQERTLSLVPFIAKYGPQLLDRLTARAGSPARGHQVVFL